MIHLLRTRSPASSSALSTLSLLSLLPFFPFLFLLPVSQPFTYFSSHVATTLGNVVVASHSLQENFLFERSFEAKLNLLLT